MLRMLRPASAFLLFFLVAGCGDGSSMLDDIAEFVQREYQRREDAKSFRADPILEASFRGNVEAVRHLLDSDPKAAREHVRSRDPVGMTALHLAVWGGHPDIVRLLLERGAEVNAMDGGGQTPVSLAARWGRADLMDILLAHGADASTRDDTGRTLLHYAAQYGHVDVMRILLERGFDVDAEASNGTPLHSAAYNRQLLAATFLLDHGANPNRIGFLGWTPLHVACSAGQGGPSNPEFVTLLLDRGAKVAPRGESGMTPLVLASGARDSTIVALLLRRGARPESATPRGFSALRSAVEARSPAVVRMLLAHGADPNERYSPLRSGRLLHRAATQDTLDVARELLGAGADANLVDDSGLTPLHVAAREGKTEMIGLLLAHRAEINARNSWNWTPLHFAASQNHVEAARALLAGGADRYARTKSGETPFKLAWGPESEAIRQLVATSDRTRR